jgi:hypothetical protein
MVNNKNTYSDRTVRYLNRTIKKNSINETIKNKKIKILENNLNHLYQYSWKCWGKNTLLYNINKRLIEYINFIENSNIYLQFNTVNNENSEGAREQTNETRTDDRNETVEQTTNETTNETKMELQKDIEEKEECTLNIEKDYCCA